MNGVTKITVSSTDEYHLRRALEIAMISHYGPPRETDTKNTSHKVSHFMVHGDKLIFGWHENLRSKHAAPAILLGTLPCKMGVDGILPVILGWLAEQEYPREPDTDGSTEKGWTVSSEHDWDEYRGTGIESSYATFWVQPFWMVYGK